MSNELVKVIESSNLEKQTGNHIREQFLPFFQQAEQWQEQVKDLVVTDISQKEEMQKAREIRIALKEIRINADKTRKNLKEDSNRYGKAVQGVYNVIEYMIIPMEKHLEEQEKFIELQEEKRRRELKHSREIECSPYMEFIPFGIQLDVISDVDFNKILNGAKLQYAIKLEQEHKAELERIEREKIEAEEKERIRIENEKLKAEAEELRQEREKAEAAKKALEEKNRKEREKAEEARIQAENKLKAEAEKARKELEDKLRAEEEVRVMLEKAEKAKANAPDKEKLIELADNLLNQNLLPDVKSGEAKTIILSVYSKFRDISKFIMDEIENL